MGLLCAEQNFENLEHLTFKNSGTPVRRTRRRKSQNMHFQELWDSCAQNKTSTISKNTLSEIVGLRFPVQTSEISKSALSKNMGLRFAEQNVGNLKTCTFRHSGTPCAQNKTSEISKMHFQEFWDSCAQNKTSEISNNALLGILGLLGNINNCTFRNSGTPVRRTGRLTPECSRTRTSGPKCAPKLYIFYLKHKFYLAT